MAMYKVTYEIKWGNQLDTKVVLVSAPNRSEAKRAAETNETLAGEWDAFWHIDCESFHDGEVFLIASSGTV